MMDFRGKMMGNYKVLERAPNNEKGEPCFLCEWIDPYGFIPPDDMDMTDVVSFDMLCRMDIWADCRETRERRRQSHDTNS